MTHFSCYDKPDLTPEHPDNESAIQAEALDSEEGKVEELKTSLEDKLEACQQKIKSLEEESLRKLADLQNMERRHSQELENSRKYGPFLLAQSLLDVVDNLDRALSFKKDSQEDQIWKGIEMTKASMLKIFSKFQIQEIDALGKPLDPQRHEAIGEEENTDYEPGQVCQILQKGYMFHDRLLRPAYVKLVKKA